MTHEEGGRHFPHHASAASDYLVAGCELPEQVSSVKGHGARRDEREDEHESHASHRMPPALNHGAGGGMHAPSRNARAFKYGTHL